MKSLLGRLLCLALVAQGPHVSCDCLEIFVRKFYAAHRWHGTGVLLWFRHAIFDRFGYAVHRTLYSVERKLGTSYFGEKGQGGIGFL
jgi:hypothetical protein